jgi:RND family efflux transporter MFP subunit
MEPSSGGSGSASRGTGEDLSCSPVPRTSASAEAGGRVGAPAPGPRRALAHARSALRRAASVLSSAVALWAVAGFGRGALGVVRPAARAQVEARAEHPPAAAPQWSALRLGTAQLGVARWTDPVPARVAIDERRAARVGTPVAGRVTQVLVEIGQPVKAGDPLFSIASPDLAGLRAEHERAVIQLDAARSTLERVQAMVDAGALAPKDAEEADRQHRQVVLSHRLAQSRLGALDIRARRGGGSELTVRSPRDGIVTDKGVRPAQQVSAASNLVGIADLFRVWIVADLLETDAVGLAVGGPVQISVPSMPELAIDTEIEHVASIIDPQRHTLGIRVSVDDAARRLRPNLFAQLRALIAPPPGTVEIDASALVTDGARSFVYVVTERRDFERRGVVVGPVREGRALILSGLAPGETVVEEGGSLLDNHAAPWRRAP